MTPTTKPTIRVTVGAHPSHKRAVVATLGPGDLLQLRLLRSQRTYVLSLFALYDQAELTAAKAGHPGLNPCSDPKKARTLT
jgi:hypothetical protein